MSMEKNVLKNILIFEFYENIRNRWIFLYFFIFLFISLLFINSGGNEPERISASLLSEILLIIPLFTLIFGSIRFVDSLPFSEVILSRTQNRFTLYLGKYLGMLLSINVGFLLGTGLPLLLFVDLGNSHINFQLLVFGVFLNAIFLAISYQIAISFQKKEFVLATSLLLWFYFYLLYDLIVLFFSVSLGDYPIEGLIILFIFFNPIDLVRVILLLQMDIAALMGFTSAFFQKYIGNQFGISLAILLLIIWILIPFYLGYKKFSRKDL